MNYKKIYFIGIKGVGMASLAVMAKQAGFIVSGSDVSLEFITDSELKKEGIYPLIGFSENNIRNFAYGMITQNLLVVCTSANKGFANEEAVWAKNNGYKVLTHGQAVGEFMNGKIFKRDDFDGISVSGCHGKTTISAMLASCLSMLNLDPSYTIGTSEIFPIGSAGHYGLGKYFIAEADEYVSDLNFDKTPKFLYQNPKISIINNIDYDHPDFYKDIGQVQQAYLSFANKTPKNGLLIINGDDGNIVKLKNTIGVLKHIITYGSHSGNDFFISKYSLDRFNSYFSLESKNLYLGDFKLSVPGYHNAKNSLPVIIILLELGFSLSKIREILPLFKGTKRRLELIGKTKSGITLIDDYAHHPQEIRTSLSVIKKAFPKKKIVCIFQPHTYSRINALLGEFASSFTDCDALILLPIYASLRESETSINNKDLAQELLNKIKIIKNNAVFLKEPDFVIKYIKGNFDKVDFIVVTMGAGDVYKISERLKQF